MTTWSISFSPYALPYFTYLYAHSLKKKKRKSANYHEWSVTRKTDKTKIKKLHDCQYKVQTGLKCTPCYLWSTALQGQFAAYSRPRQEPVHFWFVIDNGWVQKCLEAKEHDIHFPAIDCSNLVSVWHLPHLQHVAKPYFTKLTCPSFLSATVSLTWKVFQSSILTECCVKYQQVPFSIHCANYQMKKNTLLCWDEILQHLLSTTHTKDGKL